MAYITQADKKVISVALKEALKAFPSVKCSLSIHNHSSVTCTIKQGPASLIPKNGTDGSINHFFINTNYSGEAADILNAISKCMHIGHWDKSDLQTDYFHCSWYVHINVGKWGKPFIVV